MSKFFAKSYNKGALKETIEEHTLKVVNECRRLKSIINNPMISDNIWNIAEIACWIHDLGKYNGKFQKKIELNKRSISGEIPHGFLSTGYIPENIDDADFFPLFYSVAFHHERPINFSEENFNDVFEKDLKPKLKFLDWLSLNSNGNINELWYKNYYSYLDKNKQQYLNLFKEKNEEQRLNKKKYIYIKGILHRCDYAASAGIEVEDPPIIEDREKLFYNYLLKENKKAELREFQKEFKDKDNIAVVADTGLGKTGLAVLWSKRKMFYVLPNRTSTNAMFETFEKIYPENTVGLLHSSGMFYLLDKNNEDDHSIIKEYESTKMLAKPVTVTTADQLFTAVFKYFAYEKIYATLSYSDIIIDEIQGFSPQQIVPILHQIKETKKLGARYLIITATLPQLIKEEFEELGVDVFSNRPSTYDHILRHKVKIEKDKSIFELEDQILSSQGNILVIVNNVTTAQELFEKLRKNNLRAIDILHGRFVWKERGHKEEKIKNYQKSKNAIWVTTQLVEASIDIDYDILFTEAATIDSLIQRMGRIYRHRNNDYSGDYNIYIAENVDESRVKSIYEKELRDASIEKISKSLDENLFLKSAKKRDIVEEIYSKDFLEDINSNYLKEWEDIEEIINSDWDVILKSEGQKIFRDIFTVEAIPSKFSGDAENLCEELKSISNIKGENERKLSRTKILKQLKDISAPVPFYWLNNSEIENTGITTHTVLDQDYDIILLNECFKYDETGLTLNREIFDKLKDEVNKAVFI